MTEKHIDGKQVHAVPAFAETLVTLPRGAKRTIMLIADAIAIPAALWAAFVLKRDSFTTPIADYPAYLLVALGSSLVIFAVLGLYRAVVRFMGAKAMLSVIAGVTLSVAALLAYDRIHGSAQVSVSTLAIYWALALLYVVGSRFFVRYLFSRTRNGKPPARVAIYGAGDAGARLSSVLGGGLISSQSCSSTTRSPRRGAKSTGFVCAIRAICRR